MSKSNSEKSQVTDEMADYMYSAAKVIVAKRWGWTESDKEEIVQDAVCHVAKYWHYDPNRRCSWRTYASRALGNRISTVCTGMEKQRHDQLSEHMPDDDEGRVEDLADMVDEVVGDPQWNRAVKLKAEGLSWKEVAQSTGRRWKDFRKPLEKMLLLLRTAMEKGRWLDQSETPPFPEPARTAGRPSNWIVFEVDEDGNDIKTYSSINKASAALGIHHGVITAAKDGGIHERDGVRWRMERKRN